EHRHAGAFFYFPGRAAVSVMGKESSESSGAARRTTSWRHGPGPISSRSPGASHRVLRMPGRRFRMVAHSGFRAESRGLISERTSVCAVALLLRHRVAYRGPEYP